MVVAAEGLPVYRRLWNFLGSRDLSVFIFVMGMLYYLMLLAFSMVVPVPWVNNISILLPYKFLYSLFFINLIICEIKWIPVVFRKCRRPDPPGIESEIKKRFRHDVEVGRGEAVVGRLKTYLKRRGYKISAADCDLPLSIEKKNSTLLFACSGRFSPLGNLLFHSSFIFILAGFGLSSLYRFDGTLNFVEGQGISGAGREDYLNIVETEEVVIPEMNFEIGKITPSFWENMLLFTDLSAEVFHEGGKDIVRLSQPLTMNGSKLTITGISVAPEYVLRDKNGMELDRGYANLNIFMPGSDDSFRIPDTPYKVRMSFYPDFELRKGVAYSRSMNSTNPVFEVSVFKNRTRVFKGFLKLGDEASIGDVRLSFPDFKYAGLFRVVYDRGFGMIWVGLIMMIIGLSLRLLIYRKEVIVWRNNQGRTYMGCNSDYYQKLFLSELKAVAGSDLSPR